MPPTFAAAAGLCLLCASIFGTMLVLPAVAEVPVTSPVPIDSLGPRVLGSGKYSLLLTVPRGESLAALSHRMGALVGDPRAERLCVTRESATVVRVVGAGRKYRMITALVALALSRPTTRAQLGVANVDVEGTMIPEDEATAYRQGSYPDYSADAPATKCHRQP